MGNLRNALRKRKEMILEFVNDYKTYNKWNYNNSKIHSQNALEAKI